MRLKFTKYLLISLLLHAALLASLSWRRVPAVYLGMRPAELTLSLSRGAGEGVNLQPHVNKSYGGTEPVPGEKGGGDGAGKSSTAGRLVAGAYANNPPKYPAVARAMGYQGTATVELEVMPDGTCGNVTLARSSGYRVLDHAALAAVRGWIFFRGNSVSLDSPVRVTQDIVFILRNN